MTILGTRLSPGNPHWPKPKAAALPEAPLRLKPLSGCPCSLRLPQRPLEPVPFCPSHLAFQLLSRFLTKFPDKGLRMSSLHFPASPALSRGQGKVTEASWCP